MIIIIVDDEQMALSELKDTIAEIKPDAEIYCFDDYIHATAFAKEKKCDVAFLDIAMPGRNGIELAKDFKEINTETNIVFVTGYSEYAVEAFYINASGYILKPARKNDVINAFENLRTPVNYEKSKLKVQCFGNFEVFYNDEPIKFRRNITKEVFAYLIDLKGASANTNELCAALFEDDSASNKHYFRNLISDLKNTFTEAGCAEVLIFKRNSFAIDVSKIECDYYKYLSYDVAAVNSYCGEYMRQYSWAEMTNGFLTDNNI